MGTPLSQGTFLVHISLGIFVFPKLYITVVYALQNHGPDADPSYTVDQSGILSKCVSFQMYCSSAEEDDSSTHSRGFYMFSFLSLGWYWALVSNDSTLPATIH